MNYRSSSWSGQTPRALEQAFGPYTSKQIEEPKQPTPMFDIALYVLAVLVAALMTAILIAERS
jgi:hypothetical protein